MVTVAQVTPQKKPIKTINQKYTNNVQKKASHETDEICSLLNLNKEISFVRTDTINNGKKSNNIKYGIEHQRYVQYLKGIKIEDSDLRVHKIGNSIVQVNGHITMLDDVETNPKIGKKEAELKAIEYFKLEYPNKSLRLTFNKNKANSSELVLISNLYDEEDPKLHLTYKMLIENQEPLICEYVFVDAINGEIVNTKNTILNVQGTGQTRYSGTKTIDTEKKSDTLYNLVGSFGSITAIRTLNMHDTTDLNNMTDFTDNDNSWTRSEMHLDDAALDVHWAMMKACEYFYYVHGRMHYKDNGVQIISGIHNGLRNISRYNSAYDFFSFGDGLTDNISGTPDYNVMVSLDFVAHEFGHALCANTAQLTDIKETGAIQEGLSDIWAVCIENYAAPEKQKWLLGEEVLLSVYNCERDLRYPKNHYLPDTYKGQYWMSTDGCKPRLLYSQKLWSYGPLVLFANRRWFPKRRFCFWCRSGESGTNCLFSRNKLHYKICDL